MTQLGYDEVEVIPQRAGSHVTGFIATCRNAGTAANYLGVVRWYCTVKGLNRTCGPDRLKMQLKGLKKLTMN